MRDFRAFHMLRSVPNAIFGWRLALCLKWWRSAFTGKPFPNLSARFFGQIEKFKARNFAGVACPRRSRSELHPTSGLSQLKAYGGQHIVHHTGDGLYCESAFAGVQNDAAVALIELHVGERTDLLARMQATIPKFYGFPFNRSACVRHGGQVSPKLRGRAGFPQRFRISRDYTVAERVNSRPLVIENLQVRKFRGAGIKFSFARHRWKPVGAEVIPPATQSDIDRKSTRLNSS